MAKARDSRTSIGSALTAITLDRARALLFPELDAPAGPEEIWPPQTLADWVNPGAHELDAYVAELRLPTGHPSNRAQRGRPPARLRERGQLAGRLDIPCPWHHARARVLIAVRQAIRDVERARIVADEVGPRLRAKEAEATRLALRLREFIGGEYMADALAEGPAYGRIPDLLTMVARGEEIVAQMNQVLHTSILFEEIAAAISTQRAEIAPRIDPETVWKRAFVAHLCPAWVELTGAWPANGEEARFLKFASAAVATLRGEVDDGFPLSAQIREMIERGATHEDHDRFDIRERIRDANHVPAGRAPVSFANPDGEDSMFKFIQRVLREIEKGGGKPH